jgi:hypothetical protein
MSTQMIKFFRNIRQNLLNEGKTSKYFKYAIGEIILVVIGILIALQINNWNEGRKDHNTEKTHLLNLLSDLDEQKTILSDFTEVETMYETNGEDVLSHYVKNNGFVPIDTIYDKLSVLSLRRSFNPINTTYREMIASSGIGLISNPVVKKTILDYYQSLDRMSLVIQNNNANLIDGVFNPALMKYLIFMGTNSSSIYLTKSSENKTNNRFQHLKSMSEKLLKVEENELHLLNVLQLRMNISKSNKRYYVEKLKETNHLIEIIKSVLSQN